MDRHLDTAPPQNAPVEEPDAPVDPETAREIREQARGEIAELVVHELRHSLTHIELAAEREIDDFASSQTKRALDGFRSIARSLGQLADAARGAQVVEVSLPDVIVEATLDFAQSLWPPDLHGPPDVVVRADPAHESAVCLLDLGVLGHVAGVELAGKPRDNTLDDSEPDVALLHTATIRMGCDGVAGRAGNDEMLRETADKSRTSGLCNPPGGLPAPPVTCAFALILSCRRGDSVSGAM